MDNGTDQEKFDEDSWAEGIIAEARARVEADPNNPSRWAELGYICSSALHRPLQAIEPYREALKLKPNDLGYLFGLGGVLRDAGRPAEAEATYRQMLAVAPTAPEAHHLAAIGLQGLGLIGQALAELHEAIRLDPADRHHHAEIGGILERAGRLGEA